MGPDPYRPPKPDLVDLVLNGFKAPLTKEAAFYKEARAKMRSQVAGGVLDAFDFLHRESELARARICAGMPVPSWLETLNIVDPWEIELWFDNGAPTPELLRAGAAAIDSIVRFSNVVEVTHG